jgi:hypothetical protein
MRSYGERIHESGDPKVFPAGDTLAEILFMGRMVRLHLLLAAQSATARAIGGPECARTSPPASWPATPSTPGGC